jgi:hypothetical protein
MTLHDSFSERGQRFAEDLNRLDKRLEVNTGVPARRWHSKDVVIESQLALGPVASGYYRG